MRNPTICIKCAHILRRGRSKIWYDLFCTARRKPEVMNFLTGEIEGGLSDKYQYCRDVNKGGNCHLFKQR